MRPLLILSSLLSLSQIVACGPDCQSTCNLIYEESQCGIPRPGQSVKDSISRCMEECNSGLKRPGEVGDYSPNEKTPQSEKPSLDNDKQTALWMDCVKNTSCENLEKNYCAPIW